MGSIALPPSFGHDAKVLVERPSFLLVIKQIEIDRFMAHGKAEIRCNDIRHLLRAIVVLDQIKDDPPLILGEVGSALGPLSSGCRVAMSDWGGVVPRWSSIPS